MLRVVRSAGDQATQPSPTPQPATLTVTTLFGDASEERREDRRHRQRG